MHREGSAACAASLFYTFVWPMSSPSNYLEEFCMSIFAIEKISAHMGKQPKTEKKKKLPNYGPHPERGMREGAGTMICLLQVEIS